MVRNLLAASTLVVAALIGAPLHAQQPPSSPPSFRPAVTVVGEAQVNVAPDMARIEAGVSNMARTAKAASEANNLAMGKVLLELKSAGSDPKDIQTSQLSLQPQY
ncbi:SIMPL domain-containing protein, partial [Rhodopseudomonas sp. B29]|uniref:SIMPL domain-containing protein n=1 Tax=Rhodopseudomonas sp. B29 TaxID=95607 RepID=UPI0003B78B22